MTGKQRAALRSLANTTETILQVGKSGIGENLVTQVIDALEARELIKIRALDGCPLGAKEAAEQLAEACGAEVVQVIGTRFVLYKQSSKEENRKIKLV